jgi:hypothetical protein
MSGQYVAGMRKLEMNHPIVKKLLKNELLMWGLGALVVVALPLGVVVLEATTATSSSPKKATKSKSADKPGRRSPDSKSTEKPVLVAEDPLFADSSAEITDGILDPEAVFGSVATDERFVSISNAATSVASASSGELTEFSSETVGSGILYFGGGEPADDSHEGTLDVAVSEVDVASVAVVTETMKTADPSTPADDHDESDPDLIALLAAGEQPASKTDVKTAKTDGSTESSMKDDKEKEDTRERTQVTLLRPRGQVVKSIDQIIFRCRTQPKLFPFVLVRSRQKSAPWWVQNNTLRQGTYVQGRAQFGNRNTVDGSRFSVVVAFVEDIEAVPEPGTQMAEIPEDILISQELEFTMRK